MTTHAKFQDSASWLILCDPGDEVSYWAHEELQRRGLEPMHLVSADTLGAGLRWEHRIGASGVSLRIELAEGRQIFSRTVYGVLNRLRHVPHWRSIQSICAQDRHYAQQELTAFFIGWISSFRRPILNPATAQGLSGRRRHLAEWVLLASRAGLRTDTYLGSTVSTSHLFRSDDDMKERQIAYVVVVGRRAVGAAPHSVRRACERLAALSATPLLGVALRYDAHDKWTFVDATPDPDLRLGGAATLDALAEILKSGRGLGDPSMRDTD